MSNDPSITQKNDEFDAQVETLAEEYRSKMLRGNFIKVVNELESFDDFARDFEIDPYLLLKVTIGSGDELYDSINAAFDKYCESLATKQLKYEQSH